MNKTRRDFVAQSLVALTTATAANMIGGAYQCPAQSNNCGFFLLTSLAIEGLLGVKQIPYEDTEDGGKIKADDWMKALDTIPENVRFWIDSEWANCNIGEYPIQKGQLVEIEDALNGTIIFAFIARESCLDPVEPLPQGYTMTASPTLVKIAAHRGEQDHELAPRKKLPPRAER